MKHLVGEMIRPDGQTEGVERAEQGGLRRCVGDETVDCGAQVREDDIRHRDGQSIIQSEQDRLLLGINRECVFDPGVP